MPYQRIDRATLRARMQDRWDGSPFWTDDDANQGLTDALRLWNALTGYWRARVAVTLPAGDSYAAIPGTLVQGTAITLNGVTLTPGSLAGLSLIRPQWLRETTASGGAVPTRPTIWAPVSLTTIVVWPKLPAGVLNGTLQVDGVRRTPVLTTDGSFLDADDSLIGPLVGYAVHACAIKPPSRVLERTLPQLQAFLAAAVEKNQALRATDWYKRLQRASRQRGLQPTRVAAPDGTGGPGEL